MASMCFLYLLLLLLHVYSSGTALAGTTIVIQNKCPHTVWPAIQPGAGHAILARGGFQLLSRRSYSLHLPDGWSGRIWGRQGCRFNRQGNGCCVTGDCGGKLFCNGLGGNPPATLAEITLGHLDFYDVSLVDGYNLPISLTPYRGKGKCASAGCVSDLNRMCPAALQVRSNDNQVLACRSACAAFNSPRFCCTEHYANPQTCMPTHFSRIFKSACPSAYSYAFDDRSSLSTCSGATYLITFCPH